MPKYLITGAPEQGIPNVRFVFQFFFNSVIQLKNLHHFSHLALETFLQCNCSTGLAPLREAAAVMPEPGGGGQGGPYPPPPPLNIW